MPGFVAVAGTLTLTGQRRGPGLKRFQRPGKYRHPGRVKAIVDRCNLCVIVDQRESPIGRLTTWVAILTGTGDVLARRSGQRGSRP